MASTNALQRQAEQNERPIDRSSVSQESNCTRCGGLMVRDFCTDLLSGQDGLDCPTRRCVQCGDVVDPVIRWNRHLQQAGAGREMNTLNQALHRQPCV
ncbi:MAG: hypothetical protein GDA65_03950 [Nitrospira sp. CR1.1]|jgi:hypothetical protein|nr:hypothetical protein [Nitrospira sp. CR1.1]